MAVFFVCTGLLGLLAIVLAFNVGRVRGKTKIFLGDGGNTELITAMRVQANFVENVPLALILIALLLLANYGEATSAVLAMVLLVARLLHPLGMLGYLKLGRSVGAALTIGVLLVASIGLILSALGIKFY
jgi:uncharacterized protein